MEGLRGLGRELLPRGGRPCVCEYRLTFDAHPLDEREFGHAHLITTGEKEGV